jgi:hypothetical protein
MSLSPAATQRLTDKPALPSEIAFKPISIYYEHPRWFDRMFAEFDRRGTPYRKVKADEHFFDPGTLGADEGVSIVFNRMSPSAYRRDRGPSILHTINYLQHLELLGKRVINGTKAYRFEVSKALQLSLLRSLGLPFPKSRVIQNSAHAAEAAEGLRFPVVIKPNVGGSGAGVVRFDSPADLAAATKDGGVDLGLDHVGLVQEFIPARGGHITRVEGLGGKFLYAIKVHLTGETFDLCPADICRTSEGVALDNACPVEAPKAGLKVEGYHPPADVIADIERTFLASGIDVGGIEYVIDDRDGQLYYYDINALSNFVADAPKVVGFDPFVNLVDFLVEEASRV